MYYQTIMGVNAVPLHRLSYYPITNFGRLYLLLRLLIHF